MFTDKELMKFGIPAGIAVEKCRQLSQHCHENGMSRKVVRNVLHRLARSPKTFLDHELWGELAQLLLTEGQRPKAAPARPSAPYQMWGEDLDPKSIEQLQEACALPIAVRGALMPDAHLGYGLPIGGVLATRGAVVPYAVGVDIACRMRLSVLDLPLSSLEHRVDRLKTAIEAETRFGAGAHFKDPREHAVMDKDWSISPVTKTFKDRAWKQLGSSGGGNHFVEFGVLEISDASLGLDCGSYVALLSHSGSRGVGLEVCNHYSRAAKAHCKKLSIAAQHLAWLDLDSEEGAQYWAAMELMGAYAAANHELIHQHIARHLGIEVRLTVENHHNFAWKEQHDGEEVVVHRKGATPAAEGVLGVIPGSMATPGYVVRGLGNEASLQSASHGAGRALSRTQAKKRYRWQDGKSLLHHNKVEVMSAGVDELPMVYKDIELVMAAQRDLVQPLAKFLPRLVKMAP